MKQPAANKRHEPVGNYSVKQAARDICAWKCAGIVCRINRLAARIAKKAYRTNESEF